MWCDVQGRFTACQQVSANARRLKGIVFQTSGCNSRSYTEPVVLWAQRNNYTYYSLQLWTCFWSSFLSSSFGLRKEHEVSPAWLPISFCNQFNFQWLICKHLATEGSDFCTSRDKSSKHRRVGTSDKNSERKWQSTDCFTPWNVNYWFELRCRDAQCQVTVQLPHRWYSNSDTSLVSLVLWLP